MGTDAVVPKLAAIAVATQRLEVRRKVVLNKPHVELRTATKLIGLAMLCAVVVYVVNVEKQLLCLPTAFALPTVSVKDLCFNGLTVGTH